MQPVNTVFLILLILLLGACAKDEKYVEASSPYCQSNMVKNQYIVHWKKQEPTLVVEKNLKKFISLNNDEINFIEPNYTIFAKFVKKQEEEPVIPSIGSPESATAVYDMIHVRSAWYRGFFGQGLTVAVVDTGIDQKHPSLRRRLVAGWNFISDVADSRDETGHGTAMAGIITGPYLNNSSLSIAPDVKIMPIDFMTDQGGSEYHAELALSYAISHQAKIINNSWTVSCSELLRSSFVKWASENVIFINSSGNEPVDVISHGILPASLSLNNHVHVGSLDDRGHRSNFSGFGSTVLIYAPGELVPSFAQSDSGSRSVRISGTSASTAIVSAAAALLWSAFPQATASEIVSLLVDGAQQEPTVEPTLNIQQSLRLGRERFPD
ncbi:MAG: S8 family serine peptidase [Bdellovibrionota bacterium]